MPITENGIEYEIPKEIIERIPPEFYQAFFGEIVSVFGFSWLIPDKEFYNEDNPEAGYFEMIDKFLFGIEGTSGWHAAFVQTCNKLSMEWLADYVDDLEWYDFDLFSAKITEETMDHFCVSEHNSANEYYKRLIDLHFSKD